MTRDSAPGPGEKTVINVWLNDYTYPGYLDPMQEAAGKFNAAHPEYQVTIQGQDFRTMPAKVAQALTQGDPPDVAEYFYTSTQLALDTLGPDREPLFTPVGSAIAGRTEILGEPVLLDDIVPAARDYFHYDGDQLSIPQTASTVLLYANMNMLEAAGITEIPRTWAEIETACRAVAKLPDAPAHRIAWPNHGWFFLQSVAQQGGLLADHDNGRSGRAEQTTLDCAEMIAFVTWWQRLHRDGHFYFSGKRRDWNGCFTAFAEQDVAFILSSSVDAVRLIRMGKEAGFTVKAGRMPYNEEAPFAGNMIGGDSLWLRAGLDRAKQEGALAFMQYAIQPHHAVDWHKLNGRLPITRTSIDILDRDGWFAENPDLRVATEQLDAADGSPAALGPVIGEFAGIQKEITDAMHDVLAGRAEPAARFAQANSRAQRLLDAYNAYCAGPPRRTPGNLKVGW